MEVGAGTFPPATTLRALGPKPWNAAYVQPSRRPKDGRYGENPNRLQHYYQFQVILKPSPPDIQDLYLKSLQAIGIDPKVHDIRFVEDDWESPTLGAWGLGWECWCDGMQDLEFTVEQGKLWMLQTRSGKRTAKAALRIAVELANEGLISRNDAVLRVETSPEDIHGMDDVGLLVTPAVRLGLEGKERMKAEKCLADAVYFEARGEVLRGQQAVAQVIMRPSRPSSRSASETIRMFGVAVGEARRKACAMLLSSRCGLSAQTVV